MAQGKKLFVVTCNELRGLNEFLVNRPGRFHYHFRFDYPTADDIRNYLDDKLSDSAKTEIDNVIDFSRRVALNFDCLRAIAFELNLGQTFSEAISDLNIINIEREAYKVIAHFADGSTLHNKRYWMDSFSEDDKQICLYNKQGVYAGEISFSADAIKYHSLTGELYVEGSDIIIDYDYYDDETDQKAKKSLVDKKIVSVTIQRVQGNKLHYAV